MKGNIKRKKWKGKETGKGKNEDVIKSLFFCVSFL
jgi:hypothetical protein